MRSGLSVVMVLLLSSTVLAACSNDDGARASACAASPLRMHVERSDFIHAGGPDVMINDGLAQSLPL